MRSLAQQRFARQLERQDLRMRKRFPAGVFGHVIRHTTDPETGERVAECECGGFVFRHETRRTLPYRRGVIAMERAIEAHWSAMVGLSKTEGTSAGPPIRSHKM